MQPCPRSVLAALVLGAVAPAQAPPQAIVPVVTTIADSPPTITFTWPLDPTATFYSVSRRAAGGIGWGTPVTVPGGGTATGWTDTTVADGTRYEYRILKTGTPSARIVVSTGIAAAAIEHRGAVVLLVAADKVAVLGARLDRLVDDLRGDGYLVLRHEVPTSDTVVDVKARVLAEVAAHPGQVTTVFVLGHVAVPYSGQLAPDGHTDHVGAWPADLFYGELDGTWTDSTVNTTAAARPQNRNVPGDGKYDQSGLPSNVELCVGRVDFADLPSFAAGEDALLQAYLDKDHAFRHRQFTVEQRAVVDDNFGWFSGEAFASSGWREFQSLCGHGNTVAADYFGSLNGAVGGYAWSYGCGGGWYQGAGGVGSTTDFVQSQNACAFTMLFGSYFGDWDTTDNFLRAALGSGQTLASAWAGRPHWQFHPMGMGQSTGFCARLSQNDTTAGGLFTRNVHIALMGDPTLRQHVVAPPGQVVVTDTWPTAELTWTASPDAVAGYHVYRTAGPDEPFTRLTATAVAGTQWTDPTPLAGPATYLVRALRLETTPSGSYWNLSQGAFASVSLPTSAANHATYGAGCDQLSLVAAPAPVSTATSGTSVTFTLDHVPEASPGSGVRLGVVVLSLTPDLAGTPLDPLGMTGCALYVGNLDATLAFVGATATANVDWPLPPGVPPGTELFATGVALTVPGLLNAFGASTSNGVRSFVNAH